jgi:uroporphyrinogen decarboxylase
MTSRERVKAIFAREPADRCGFWLGNPHVETTPKYLDYFNLNTEEELRQFLYDDYRWICPQWNSYKHPDGHGLFPLRDERIATAEAGSDRKTGHNTPGPFAKTERIEDVEAYNWPKLEYLDFTETIEQLQNAGDVYRASGFWSSFFHDVADLFGMQEYFLKMYTHPEIVEEVTRRVCTFYMEANDLFFKEAGDLVDGFFFGNDFGTQIDLLVSPDLFNKFVMPWFKKFTKQGHDYGYQVILHSCGAIHRVINQLIDAEVDALHPLQAKAAKMDADTLATDFGGRISFLGGIDTQNLLVHGTPDEIRTEVRRVKETLGPHVVISPSHEALLPNVPPGNVYAMAEEARST